MWIKTLGSMRSTIVGGAVQVLYALSETRAPGTIVATFRATTFVNAQTRLDIELGSWGSSIALQASHSQNGHASLGVAEKLTLARSFRPRALSMIFCANNS